MPFMQHLKVMVVDDTSVSRMLLVEGLNEIGIKNTVLAADGEQALQLMMAAPCHIVISDFNMPKLDGLQLLKALREFAPTRQCCLHPGHRQGRPRHDRGGQEIGLNNFLAKPFTTATLKATIEAVVGKLV